MDAAESAGEGGVTGEVLAPSGEVEGDDLDGSGGMGKDADMVRDALLGVGAGAAVNAIADAGENFGVVVDTDVGGHEVAGVGEGRGEVTDADERVDDGADVAGDALEVEGDIKVSVNDAGAGGVTRTGNVASAVDMGAEALNKIEGKRSPIGSRERQWP
jgi:hypothetical protein